MQPEEKYLHYDALSISRYVQCFRKTITINIFSSSACYGQSITSKRLLSKRKNWNIDELCVAQLQLIAL
ncbi:CLUMA_CG005061, isoform A [Clunio marinus]|uniref:CLUMA_CG005061, isoform A n=1 Tax=Clunio marinus TaxID=568069 RepID=A0A1J1HVK3_9DIPT|nr:CLUMA_CG005061, isoform A [Clunio marinus]